MLVTEKDRGHTVSMLLRSGKAGPPPRHGHEAFVGLVTDVTEELVTIEFGTWGKFTSLSVRQEWILSVLRYSEEYVRNYNARREEEVPFDFPSILGYKPVARPKRRRRGKEA